MTAQESNGQTVGQEGIQRIINDGCGKWLAGQKRVALKCGRAWRCKQVSSGGQALHMGPHTGPVGPVGWTSACFVLLVVFPMHV